jgi:hypothetical protein
MPIYATNGTRDIPRATAFWGPILQSLGPAALPETGDGWAGWGKDHDIGFGLYLCPPFDGKEAHAGTGGTFGFTARDAAQVRDLYALALRNGGSDAGGPGIRDHYTPDFHVADVRARDGHKPAFVFYYHDPAEDNE